MFHFHKQQKNSYAGSLLITFAGLLISVTLDHSLWLSCLATEFLKDTILKVFSFTLLQCLSCLLLLPFLLMPCPHNVNFFIRCHWCVVHPWCDGVGLLPVEEASRAEYSPDL